jgi:anti-sigma B factor antagonist
MGILSPQRFSQQPSVRLWRPVTFRASERKGVPMPRNGSPIAVTSDFLNQDVALIVVEGEIDISSAPLVVDELAIALRPPAPELVVVDLSRVTFLGSEGVRLLINAHERAQNVSAHLRVVASQRAVLRPLEITGTLSMLEIYGSQARALKEEHVPEL